MGRLDRGGLHVGPFLYRCFQHRGRVLPVDDVAYGESRRARWCRSGQERLLAGGNDFAPEEGGRFQGHQVLFPNRSGQAGGEGGH